MLRGPLVFLIALALPAAGQLAQVDPQITRIVGEISADHVSSNLKKLESFETRGNYTDPNQQNRGIGAARRWIYDQFRSYSPKLEVGFDSFQVKAKGRIFRDVEVVNVVAVLPGIAQPEKRIIISGHYDSVSIIRRAAATANPEFGAGGADVIDNEKSVDAPAPGVTDDASGTSVVLEAARVLSQYQFEKTIVFIAFAAEEIGLVGSTLYADRAQQRGEQIEAVLNNDIVGSDTTNTGRVENTYVHVFSDEPMDSGPRSVARYVRETAMHYVPGFRAEPIFRADRFSRGGDHTPFALDGFAAVRFTTPAENLPAQHSANDTFDKAAPNYIAQVARVNAAVAANLAWAPSAPVVTRVATTGTNKGRRLPTLERGKNQMDAVLKWTDAKPAEDLAGYAVVMRSTTQPFWDREIFVGKVNEYTLPGVNIDSVVLGVKAVDKEGHESLVSAYVGAPTVKNIIDLK
jgi:hypothetical protein